MDKLRTFPSVNIFPRVHEKQCRNVNSKSYDNYIYKGGQRWTFDLEWTQHYFGTFFLDNLHLEGTYKWSTPTNKRITFEGCFYCNDLEGYGLMSYNDQRTFEGLFRKNKPFGPGVLTYANGTQDAGFWIHKQLVRLACIVYPDWVPKLGKTLLGKTKLLGYRRIITVDGRREDLAKDILQELNADDASLHDSDALYANFIRNPNSNFFNRPLFNEEFYGNQTHAINIATHSSDMYQIVNRVSGVSYDMSYSVRSQNTYTSTNNSGSSIHKITIKEILAWNNGELSVDLLRHTFLHRKYEKNMSFKLYKLVQGIRGSFKSPGAQESACVEFLKSCSSGNSDLARRIFLTYHLNPDVCDSKGNSGVIFAAARDRCKLIKDLWGYGANIDFLNDEGLTALTLCLCRYLALLYKVVDWEKAFLHDLATPSNYYIQQPDLYPSGSCKTLIEEASLNTNTSSTTTSDELSAWENNAAALEKQLHKDSCSECQFSQDSKLKLLKEDVNNVKVSFSFEKLLSLIQDETSPDSNVNQALIQDIKQRLKNENVAKDFSEFQEPYVYIPPEDVEQKYVFVEEYVIPPKPPKQKKNKKEGKMKPKRDKKGSRSSKSKSSSASRNSAKKKSPKVKSKKKTLENTPVEPVETEEMITQKIIRAKLQVIEKTILTLLEVGADCNIGDVPLCGLLLATFTKQPEIFQGMLKKCQDFNVTTPNENLTIFHLLASFAPTEETVKMIDALTSYIINPNLYASPNHWLRQKEEILAKVHLDNDLGKTPLQLLCMRADFSICDSNLENLCRSLLKAGADPNLEYLGHTALTLALIKGNLRLVEVLLQSGLVDPNQILGLRMGTPLTVLLLKRYKNLLPSEVSQDLYRMLIKYHANPLNTTGELRNAVEFDIAEHAEPVKVKKGGRSKPGKNKKADKKKAKKSSKKSSKGSKKSKKPPTTEEVLREFLIEAGRSAVKKHMEGVSVKYLYDLAAYNLLKGESQAIDLVKSLTLGRSRNILQLLIEKGLIQEPELRTCYKLLKFIKKQGLEDDSDEVNKESIHNMVEALNLQSNLETSHFLIDPTIDLDKEKYAVCFECLTKKDKHLIACPKCEQILYCSQECNKVSNGRKPKQHLCGLLFYNNEKRAQDAREANGEPRTKSRMEEMRKMCIKYKEKKDNELEERMKLEKNIKLGLVSREKRTKKDSAMKFSGKLRFGKAAFSKPTGNKKIWVKTTNRETSSGTDNTIGKKKNKWKDKEETDEALSNCEERGSRKERKGKAKFDTSSESGVSDKVNRKDFEKEINRKSKKSEYSHSNKSYSIYSSPELDTDSVKDGHPKRNIHKNKNAGVKSDGSDSDKTFTNGKNKLLTPSEKQEGKDGNAISFHNKQKSGGKRSRDIGSKDIMVEEKSKKQIRNQKTRKNNKQREEGSSDEKYNNNEKKIGKKNVQKGLSAGEYYEDMPIKDHAKKGRKQIERTVSEAGKGRGKNKLRNNGKQQRQHKASLVSDGRTSEVVHKGGKSTTRKRTNQTKSSSKSRYSTSDSEFVTKSGTRNKTRNQLPSSSEKEELFHPNTRSFKSAVPQKETTFSKRKFSALEESQDAGKIKSHLRENVKRLPLKFQKFMQQFSSHFESFDWINMMLPYAVYYNEQLYYKFSDEYPIFIPTYSDV